MVKNPPASAGEAGDAGSVPGCTGLILKCPVKVGNPFQTTQGNRLSCRDQEGQTSPRVAMESWGLRSSHCRAEETSPRRVSGT